ncbi:MAG TPA: hypothetical protein VFI47_24450 [Acidimicrobiales bacterium]|nr:hypothetical protein [Acidimicrobiales bacterium]
MSDTRARRLAAAGIVLLGLVVTAVVAPPVSAGSSGPGGIAGPAEVEPVDLPGNRPGTGQIYNGLEEADSGRCVGGFAVGGEETCTHGPDAPLPGLTMADEVPASADATLAAAAAVCTGDGTSGPRVEVLYVHAPGNDRYAQYAASIAQWAVGVDTIYDESAKETGGRRHVRFVHGADCVPAVTDVEISSAALSNISQMISALRGQGFNRTDRKYLIFGDAGVYCGIGEFAGDTRKSASNRSNSGPSFARVDRSCWAPGPAAHELGHTLGAVNNNAPNSSLGGHCTDEWDVMCYSDSPYYPAMRTICADRAHDDRLDCGHDDYYHTAPAAGTYLAGNWNVADSVFLVSEDAPPPTTTPPPPPSTTSTSTTTTSTTTTSTTAPPPSTTATTVTPPTTAGPTTTTTTPPPPPPPATCDGYSLRYTGSFTAPGSQVQPGGRFYLARSGLHAACLDGPTGANFDLRLQKFSGWRWLTVAEATGPNADAELTYTGTMGLYRLVVEDVSGAGDYTLGVRRP